MRHGGLFGSVGVGSVWQALSCLGNSVCVLLSTFSDTTMSSVLLLGLTLPLHDAHPDFPDLLLLLVFLDFAITAKNQTADPEQANSF